ncbi:hypothetical protein KEM48_011147 [Puccinia striiformis f. sp. tritici PST-130]|nr:hypothetical protein KEM48_011147 [Puccinia striiformis f. sp. tritici PST-130]
MDAATWRTYGPSKYPGGRDQFRLEISLLKAVTDALAKQIPLLIEKHADPGLKFLIGYLAQANQVGILTGQNDHAHHPIGSYDAFNSDTSNSTAVAYREYEIKGQLELIRTHITQQPSLTDTEGGNPEVKAPLDLFISTLAGQASDRVRRLAGTSVHHSDQVPPPTPRATRLPIKATDDKRPMDNRLDESIRTFNSDESIDQMGSE